MSASPFESSAESTSGPSQVTAKPVARLQVGAASALLAFVVALALLLRLASLGTIPGNVTADEADNLQVAYRILVGNNGPGLFGLDWKPAPAFSVYLITLSMQIFGWTIAGMRMASALLSTVALVPFYFLARQRLSTSASLVATFLLATSLWFLHFSRSGWENSQVVLFTACAGLLLELGLRRKRLLYFVGAGIFCALGWYGYFAGRVIVAALVAYLPFAILEYRQQWRKVILGYAIMLTTTAIVFAPEVPTIVGNWTAFDSRTSSVLITNAKLPYHGVESSGQLWLEQIERTFRAFFLLDGSAVNNARYFPVGRPILDPITGGLYLLGLVFAVTSPRKTMLWWLLLLVPLATTQVLAIGAPDLARAIGALPAIYLMVGLGFEGLASRHGTAGKSLQLLVIGLLPIAGVLNVSGYFDWIRQPGPLEARGPSVEASEFDVWQQLQVESASAGLWGFTASQWQDLRKRLGLPEKTRSASDASAATIPPKPRTSPSKPESQQPEGKADLAQVETVIGGEGTLEEPRGVAIGPDGDVFVADSAGRIVRYTAAGSLRAEWANRGSAEGEFGQPWDIVVDGRGRAFVVDAENNVVRRLAANGQLDATILGAAGLYRPRGITIDASGSLYVADTGQQRVVKFDEDGQVIMSIGSATGATFNQPTDVAVDGNGDVYVVEPDSGRLQKLNAAGEPVTSWEIPRANTVDSPHLAAAGGLLFVTDPSRQRIDAYTDEGDFVGYFGGVAGAGPPLLTGIAIDSLGRVWSVDTRGASVLGYSRVNSP